MDEKETVRHDQAELDHLEDEIQQARKHLNERTHMEKEEPYLFEDDQESETGPGDDNVPG
jgi:hypothetical protein